MKFITHILIILCCSALLTPISAQTDSLPNLLSTLNAEQKTKVLEYAHHLGAYYGKPLETTCKMLDAKNQGRVLQYIAVLKNPEKVGATTVRWNRDTIPFGQIEEGMILLDSFMVTNTGTAPYIIKGAKGNCDCTVLRYPAFPVMPGDSAVVRIEFDSNKKTGRARPGIIIYDNSSPNRRNILYLDGYITPRKEVKIIRH